MDVLFALLVVGFFTLLYFGQGYFAWLLGGGGLLFIASQLGIQGNLFDITLIFFIVLALLLGVPLLRQRIVTPLIRPVLAAALPRMSDTERIALEAGDVWWDAELFSGQPNWAQLREYSPHHLSDDEQAFLNGPVEQLCVMLDEWDTTQRTDLSPEAWDFIKSNGFFGMIIPKEYGGLGFSARAHSEVIMKLASRSITSMVTVMVPNSLGPAELLMRYGTDEQKKHFLPRLATAEEIPCFALTEPKAGSDAGAAESFGIVCKANIDGREQLALRLTWDKRYTTLAPVATVLGLAFNLKDPDHLIGDQEEYGITCALVPTNLPGVEIGRRHDPLGAVFLNGPTTGKEVIVPIDAIIGGQKMAGEGWRMLMDCLSAGRGISLPSMACGAGELALRVASGYGLVREQFRLPIVRFEGIEERLSRIAGLTYIANGSRKLTLMAIDSGNHPSVISAIVKAYLTENMRIIINDAMDIVAGAGISQGPRNVLANAYASLPIGITVEGANILTRSLIIYGQGAIRCHPHVHDEMEGAVSGNHKKLDAAFFGHINFVSANLARALVRSWTGARLIQTPFRHKVQRYTQRLTQFSSVFALTSDAAMGTLGASLKRREKLSGRLADVLGWLYLASGTMKQYLDDGFRERDRDIFCWSMEHCLHQIQEALLGFYANLPVPMLGGAFRWIAFPFGRSCQPPSDRLGARVARRLIHDPETRRAWSSHIFEPNDSLDDPGIGKIERAYQVCLEALPVKAKIRDAVKKGKVKADSVIATIDLAEREGVVTSDEATLMRNAESLRDDLIQVDAFTDEQFRQKVS